MVEWSARTPEQRQVNRESKMRHRYAHYGEVIEKEREKNRRYREANREKIRERERARYEKIRTLAGKPVKEYTPRKPRGEEPPIVLPRKFGTLDKICKVAT